jgi:hypothetical protein
MVGGVTPEMIRDIEKGALTPGKRKHSWNAVLVKR